MSTVKKNDIYVTNFVEQNGGGSTSTIIDLSGYTLSSEEVDVTDAFPTGYKPKAGDIARLNEFTELYFAGGHFNPHDGVYWTALYGYATPDDESAEMLIVGCSSGVVYARIFEI